MATKLDILAFGAHPDDVELGCGATIAKHVASGKKVGIIDLTRGELGTRGSAEIRDLEAEKSADILGLELRKNLNFKDGFFTNDEAHQLQLIKVIREYQPDIVLCNAVCDRHPDHSKASELTSSSCFLAGLRKIETGQEAWRPKLVYHYIQFKNIDPDFVVDVSDFMEQKILAVKAFSSQFYNPKSKEPNTIISSQGFLDSIRYRAADLGRLSGVDYAEGFTVEKLPVLNLLEDLY